MASSTDVAKALQAYLSVLATDPGALANYLSNRPFAVRKWYATNRESLRGIDPDAIPQAEEILINGDFTQAQVVFADAGPLYSDGPTLSLWVTSWVTSWVTTHPDDPDA